MKKKRKKLPSLRSLERKADKLMSLYVRAITIEKYGKCPLCGVNPVQCLFHIISRRRKIVRWNLGNAIGSCSPCNYVENYFSDLSRAWFIRNRGVNTYLRLVDEAMGRREFTREDMQYIIATFERLLQKINPALGKEIGSKSQSGV